MPIDGVSEIVRIPRLGKIHLGVKTKSNKEGRTVEYPKATDYFVVPDEVKVVYGEKPVELDIMFPVEEPELFAQQWLRAYSLTQGLVCIGSGSEARRKVDIETGAMADHSTKQWVWKEVSCNPQECPEYQTSRCRRVMNLQFLLPQVPGLGVYQIDTSSFYSIVNINSMIKMLKGMLGKCSLIPLTLALGPIEVSPPGKSKKTVYIMHIKKNVKLAELARVALLPTAKMFIPEPETQEPPEDLFPEGVIADQDKVTKVEGEKTGKEDELFPPEEREQELDIPQVDDELLKGWQIVRSTVTELKVTDNQIRKWFSRYKIDMKLSDFKTALPPVGLDNETLSKFQTMLDVYRENKEHQQLPGQQT